MGTLIFIGILFTSIIPMTLVMKQADTVYTQNVHETEASDQERDNEDIDVYAFPVAEDSDDIKVRIVNKGVVPVSIVRVWINNDTFVQNVSVASQEVATLGPFTLSPSDGDTYAIKVTTDRGNTYASSSGTLYFDNGYWFTPSLAIVVSISNFIGKYRIWVENETWGPILTYETTGIDWGDVIHTILVDVPDTYQISIEKKKGGDWVGLPGTPVNAVIIWPNGSPIVNVLADGTVW